MITGQDQAAVLLSCPALCWRTGLDPEFCPALPLSRTGTDRTAARTGPLVPSCSSSFSFHDENYYSLCCICWKMTLDNRNISLAIFFLFIFCPAILSSSLCSIDFFPYVSGTQLNLTLYSQMLPFGKVGLVFLSVLACSHDIWFLSTLINMPTHFWINPYA